jgi:hypothetical protein
MLGHLLFLTNALVGPLIDATTACSFPSVLRFPPWYHNDWPRETIPGHPCLRTSTLELDVGILTDLWPFDYQCMMVIHLMSIGGQREKGLIYLCTS